MVAPRSFLLHFTGKDSSDLELNILDLRSILVCLSHLCAFIQATMWKRRQAPSVRLEGEEGGREGKHLEGESCAHHRECSSKSNS